MNQDISRSIKIHEENRREMIIYCGMAICVVREVRFFCAQAKPGQFQL